MPYWRLLNGKHCQTSHFRLSLCCNHHNLEDDTKAKHQRVNYTGNMIHSEAYISGIMNKSGYSASVIQKPDYYCFEGLHTAAVGAELILRPVSDTLLGTYCLVR